MSFVFKFLILESNKYTKVMKILILMYVDDNLTHIQTPPK